MNEENTKATIPYYVHEGELERMERINRRMIIIIALENRCLNQVFLLKEFLLKTGENWRKNV